MTWGFPRRNKGNNAPRKDGHSSAWENSGGQVFALAERVSEAWGLDGGDDGANTDEIDGMV